MLILEVGSEGGKDKFQHLFIGYLAHAFDSLSSNRNRKGTIKKKRSGSKNLNVAASVMKESTQPKLF